MMGLHIMLQKCGIDGPKWDYIRQGNDRKFPKLIDWNKIIEHPYDEDHVVSYFRPTNIPELRKKINNTDWDDKDRYLHLMDLLEEDEDYWLYFSY